MLDAPSKYTVNPAYVYQYQGEEIAARNERARLVWAAIGRLPDRERVTVILRMEGLTFSGIAELMSVSHECVRQMEFRAMDMLRSIFAEMGIGSLTEII